MVPPLYTSRRRAAAAKVVELLLKWGAEQAPDSSGATPLHKACAPACETTEAAQSSRSSLRMAPT